MSDAIFRDIAELAARRGEVSVDKIKPETRLAGDLGLAGGDAGELMSAFAEHYGVDLSGFHFLRYFGEEGWDFLRPFVEWTACMLSPSFAQRWRAALDAEREITIAHLVDVAHSKTWLHPGPEHRPPPPSWFGAVLAIVMGAPILFLGVVGLIAGYALLTGEAQAPIVAVLTALVLAGLPLFMGYVAWRNIQRKLATA